MPTLMGLIFLLLAQLTTPNDAGVAIGHIHLLSKDPDLQKKIWVEAFGAQVTKAGTLEMLLWHDRVLA